MTARKDLLDRNDPRDLDKSQNLEDQRKQGERPPIGGDENAQPAPVASGTGAAKQPHRSDWRPSLMDESEHRPQDEGGSTPTP